MNKASKKFFYALFILSIVAGSFVAGSWYNQSHTAKNLNYPAMTPVAVSADMKGDDEKVPSPLSAGAVKISPEKQQMIGVRIDQVEKTPGSDTLRALGRVAIDENRIYRLVTLVEGWVREIRGGTTGSIVKKDQLLATFYSRDIFTPQQSYVYALNSLDRVKKEGMDIQTKNQIQTAEDTLFALGMEEGQIREIAKDRKTTRDIEIRAPISGLVVQRNIYPRQRFERGTEWYRIADLSRVWILADVFEKEANYFRPGAHVQITLPHQQKKFQAVVSDTPPQFDPNTRTLKVRLEADNPGFILRPDMFVDVEFPVKLPAAITVPADAVLDSGIRKTVFVEAGNGIFEPREVETGWRIGNRVEIVSGLKPGERIVISGNFLIDSESKLGMAAMGMQTTFTKDPVCGQEVSPKKAEKAGRKSTLAGKTYYFDSDECKEQFEKNPVSFIKKISEESSVEKPPASSKSLKKGQGHDHS